MTVPKCGAKTRSGGTCGQKAGWGTDHVGEGRCKLHGGRNPVKHGRYSKITRPRLKQLIDDFSADSDPLDITHELHLLRALVLDYVERYDGFTDALIAWHASFGEEYRKAYGIWRERMIRLTENGDWQEVEPEDLPHPPDPREYENKPRQVTDILAVGTFVDKITRIVERIERMRQEGTITLATLERVLEQVGVELVATLREEVEDEAVRTRILNSFQERWGSVRLTPDGGPPQRARQRPLN
jgi:hypothetical protein